jgi:hypothetical protein
VASQEESSIVESEIDTARELSPLQFFQPGDNPVGRRDEGDFVPHAQRVDPRSVVVFEGTDMDEVIVSEEDKPLDTSAIDPRDPRHDHSQYDLPEEEDESEETPEPQKNLQVPFAAP